MSTCVHGWILSAGPPGRLAQPKGCREGFVHRKKDIQAEGRAQQTLGGANGQYLHWPWDPPGSE